MFVKQSISRKLYIRTTFVSTRFQSLCIANLNRFENILNFLLNIILHASFRFGRLLIGVVTLSFHSIRALVYRFKTGIRKEIKTFIILLHLNASLGIHLIVPVWYDANKYSLLFLVLILFYDIKSIDFWQLNILLFW